jgi:hypothetical protein
MIYNKTVNDNIIIHIHRRPVVRDFRLFRPKKIGTQVFDLILTPEPLPSPHPFLDLPPQSR